MRPFRCVRPTRLQEVIDFLKEYGGDAALLAGGTDLVVGLRDEKLAPRVIIEDGARFKGSIEMDVKLPANL